MTKKKQIKFMPIGVYTVVSKYGKSSIQVPLLKNALTKKELEPLQSQLLEDLSSAKLTVTLRMEKRK